MASGNPGAVQFLDECTVRSPELKEHGEALYQQYRIWAEAQGYRYPLTRPKFTQRLKAKGFASETASLPGFSNSVRCYIGVKFIEKLPKF